MPAALETLVLSFGLVISILRSHTFAVFNVFYYGWNSLTALIEEGYHSTNPYHNSIHATDVTQAMHCFLQEEKVSLSQIAREIFSPYEINQSVVQFRINLYVQGKCNKKKYTYICFCSLYSIF